VILATHRMKVCFIAWIDAHACRETFEFVFGRIENGIFIEHLGCITSKLWSSESPNISSFEPDVFTRAHSIFFDAVRHLGILCIVVIIRKICVTASRAGLSGLSHVWMPTFKLSTTCGFHRRTISTLSIFFNLSSPNLHHNALLCAFLWTVTTPTTP